MILKNKCLLILLLAISFFSNAQTSDGKSTVYHYFGRVELQESNTVLLIASSSSSSSVLFDFEGNSCEISLQSVDTYDH